MYILECADGSYYTGSTKNLKLRLTEHQKGEGANYTRKRLPVKLVYYEAFGRIDKAFYREKQIQGWSRKKKDVLIRSWLRWLSKATPAEQKLRWLSGAEASGAEASGAEAQLHKLAECKNQSNFKNYENK